MGISTALVQNFSHKHHYVKENIYSATSLTNFAGNFLYKPTAQFVNRSDFFCAIDLVNECCFYLFVLCWCFDESFTRQTRQYIDVFKIFKKSEIEWI